VSAIARGPAGPTGRLPRGRHGLPREAVADSQRIRILTAMIEVVAARGYADTRVVDVIGTAGVSRKTFYELFDSKEDCFLAAYDILLGRVLEVAEAGFGVEPETPWPERIESGLRAILAHLAAHPGEARFALVEVLAAGPRALARRDAVMRQFTGFIETGRSESSIIDLPGSTAQTVAGGVTELLYSEVLHGSAARLPARLPELVFLIVLPFLGAERAAAERERARLA
jgi:AcrR family transcriptional regulator